MKTAHLLAGTLAGSLMFASLGFAAGDHLSQSATAADQEDQAQLKADEAALAREKNKLNADQATLQADTRSGRMAAESKDNEKVYKDRLAITGETKDIAHDSSGSLQMKADEAALSRERAQLQADRTTLKADLEAGRMAAESPDAERVYKDQQAIEDQHKAIIADRSTLQADKN